MNEGLADCRPRFSRVPPGCPRYVWDPAVHEAFEENCYFYILRASDANWTIKLHTELERELDAAGVPGVTAYGLYGYYDALIRVWATEGVRRRIVRTFRGLTRFIEDIGEFRVDLTNYTFATKHPSEATINSLIPQIDEVLGMEAQSNQSGSTNGSFEKLLGESLIHEVPSVEGVKFYMLLKPVGQRLRLTDDEGSRLLASCLDSDIQGVSVYTGLGSFAHLIEGIRPTFDELLPALRPVHETAQSLDLRTMTFPIANMPVVNESDLLCRIGSRGHQTQISPELANEALLALHLQNSKVILDGLTNQQLGAFLSLYSSFKAEFGTTEQWDRMSGILRASLQGDRDQLGNLLSFLTYIESDLRDLLPRLLAKELGGNWYRLLTSEVSLNGDREKWTLRQYIDALRWAKDRSNTIREFLDRHLGEEWTSGLRKVQDLRNDYAHGRVLSYSSFTAFDGDWGGILDRVFHAAKLARGLHAAALEISSGPNR